MTTPRAPMRLRWLGVVLTAATLAACSKKPASDGADRPEACQKVSACCKAATELDADFTLVCNRAEAASTELACDGKLQEIKTIIETKGVALPAGCR